MKARKPLPDLKFTLFVLLHTSYKKYYFSIIFGGLSPDRREMMRYYVAIDGGGTKTDAALFDDGGHLIRRAIGGSTNINALTEGEIRETLRSLFAELFVDEKPEAITRCFAGMAGADHPVLNDRLKALLTETLPVPCGDIVIENDAVNALWSGTDGKPGLVVIAGTGTIAYGRKADGESFRIGGWGHLIGDEGSGYAIGKEALRHALRAHDGRDSPSLLYENIKAHFKIEAMPDVIPLVYGAGKSVFAGLVPVVLKAVDAGDPTALRILRNAADDLAELIEAGCRRFGDNPPLIVLAGGLWRSERLRSLATERFKQTFIVPEIPPVYGSMVGALGSDADEKLLDRLKRQFDL